MISMILEKRLSHILRNKKVNLEAGSNVPAGTEAMIGCARSMLERGNRWKNQFGDGRAGERIIEILTNR